MRRLQVAPILGRSAGRGISELPPLRHRFDLINDKGQRMRGIRWLLVMDRPQPAMADATLSAHRPQPGAVLAAQGPVGIPGIAGRSFLHRNPPVVEILRVSNVDTLPRRGRIEYNRCPAVRDGVYCLYVGEPLPPAGPGGLLPPVSCLFVTTPAAAFWCCTRALHPHCALLGAQRPSRRGTKAGGCATKSRSFPAVSCDKK